HRCDHRKRNALRSPASRFPGCPDLPGLRAADPVANHRPRCVFGQMTHIAAIVAALEPGEQHYLSQARQMQALSFAVHIPLVCFGIAFPALLLYVESRYLRTGDELYRTLARRWSRIMAALFAAGVVTGTILSFELGLLWPNFTGTFG